MSGFSFSTNPSSSSSSSSTPLFSALSSSSSGFSFSNPSSSFSSPSPFAPSSTSSSSSSSSSLPFGLSVAPSSSPNPSSSSATPSPFSFSFNSSSFATPSLFGATASTSASSTSAPSFGFGLPNSSVSSAASAPSLSFGFGSSASAFTSAAAASSPLFGAASTGAASSPFGAFASSGSTTTSNLFGSAASTSVSTTSTTLFGSSSSGSVSTSTTSLFGSSSSSSISTGTTAAPFSSNLFGSSSSSSVSTSTSTPAFSSPLFGSSSSASAATSFPNLFGPSYSPISSSISSSPFSAVSAPAVSFPATSAFSKGTGSSLFTTVSSSTPSAGSSSSGSSLFPFGTPVSYGLQASLAFSPFGNVASTIDSAAPAATASSTQAAKPPSIGFETASSSLFSTVTTTVSASTPAATITSSPAASAAPSSAFPAFGVSSSSSTTASTATATAASSATTVSFPSFGITNTAASSGTTSSLPSFSLSTKTSAAASSVQPQSTVAATLFRPPFPIVGSCSGGFAMFLKVGLGEGEEEFDGEEEVKAEGGQGRDGLAKQPIVSMAGQEIVAPRLRTEQDETNKVMKVSSAQESLVSTIISTTSFVPVELATNPSVVSMSANIMHKVLPAEAIVVTTNAPNEELNGASSARFTHPSNEVQLGEEKACIFVEMEVEDKTGVTSSVFEGDEASARGAGSQTFCVSAPFIDVNGYCISTQNGLIVKQIFDKYGDITKESRMKSIAAKSGFLELVADAVRRLCNRSMKTLGLDELRLIEQHTADALSVGFHVNWLQQRVEKIIEASDYSLHLMELDKLAKQIDKAKRSLMEMELRQMICMQEVAAVKGKMEENDFGESNLGEGLL